MIETPARGSPKKGANYTAGADARPNRDHDAALKAPQIPEFKGIYS